MSDVNVGPPKVEPWMRGTLTDVPAILRAVLHALEQAREDVEKWCTELIDDELNLRMHGCGSVAFHVRHAAGSIDRLLTYAEGEQLSPEQLTALKTEMEIPATRARLIAEFTIAVQRASKRIRGFDVTQFEQPRTIGRRKLPTTLGGILVHVAEHTQRHIGAMIVTAKIAKAQRAERMSA